MTERDWAEVVVDFKRFCADHQLPTAILLTGEASPVYNTEMPSSLALGVIDTAKLIVEIGIADGYRNALIVHTPAPEVTP